MIFSTFHIQTNLFTLLICFHNSINSLRGRALQGEMQFQSLSYYTLSSLCVIRSVAAED